MQSDEKPAAGAEQLDAEIGQALNRRIMQSALFHRVGEGIDPVHAHQFAKAGLLDDIGPPKVPDGIGAILEDLGHADRVEGPFGPIVFFREGDGATAIDADSLLLHPNDGIRCSAFAFFKTGISNNWVTHQTAERIRAREDDIQSSEVARWRSAGIELIETLREDLFLHLAGLRQSIAHRFQDGVNTHLTFLMRPSLRALQYVRPPLYCPTEQREELKHWIDECAAMSTLGAALSSYQEKLGYVPLRNEYSATRLVKEWLRKNDSPDSSFWDDIWTWAQRTESPIAAFHAISVAMNVPGARPADLDLFWEEALKVLNVRESQQSPSTAAWRLYCELASHFSRHFESLHPGQQGERVACYAWWLTDLLGQIIAAPESQAETMLQRVVLPEGEISFSKWLVARSHIIPSSLRYATLYLSSVWAMSLLAQFSNCEDQGCLRNSSPEVKDKIGEILRGYLISSPLPDEWKADEKVFAFQQNDNLEQLCEVVIPSDELDAFRQVISFRRHLHDAGELKSSLQRVVNVTPLEQLLTMLYLKDAAFSSSETEPAIISWIEGADGFVHCLQNLPTNVVEHLLEMLADFQNRQSPDLMVRIPHLIAHAIDSVVDEERAKRLFLSVFFMSISGGVVSPLQRALATKWRSTLMEVARISRENAVHITQFAEPWVSGRIRATSVAISRLIGPRYSQGLPDNPERDVNQVTDGVSTDQGHS